MRSQRFSEATLYVGVDRSDIVA